MSVQLKNFKIKNDFIDSFLNFALIFVGLLAGCFLFSLFGIFFSFSLCLIKFDGFLVFIHFKLFF